ncbi:MAG: hypothetical protein KAH72_03815 [Flavobacteriaceae bacterium]|nr:hypothetical protein [Flavobacteriaceae bacterium]
MNRIGIIDDQKDQRITLKHGLESFLEINNSDLEVIDIFPFDTTTFKEYFSWIENESIKCLIFDEMMHNDKENGAGPVGYKGNELVEIIRKRVKDIPIYIITANTNTEELINKFGEFEDIIDREDFYESDKYVKRIIRATQRYLNENSNELEELQVLSEKIAVGESNEEDLKRLKALQVKLQMPIDIGAGERKDWLDEYEVRINELEELKKELLSKLK